MSHIEINLQRVEGQGGIKFRQRSDAIGCGGGNVAEEIHRVRSTGVVGGRSIGVTGGERRSRCGGHIQPAPAIRKLGRTAKAVKIFEERQCCDLVTSRLEGHSQRIGKISVEAFADNIHVIFRIAGQIGEGNHSIAGAGKHCRGQIHRTFFSVCIKPRHIISIRQPMQVGSAVGDIIDKYVIHTGTRRDIGDVNVVHIHNIGSIIRHTECQEVPVASITGCRKGHFLPFVNGVGRKRTYQFKRVVIVRVAHNTNLDEIGGAALLGPEADLQAVHPH